MDFPPLPLLPACAQTLEELLCFPSAFEPIFVAIDFEATGRVINNFSFGFRKENTQVGISILDTRELHFSSAAKKAAAVQIFNFITGSAEYYLKSSQKFVWGRSGYISSTKAAVLKSLNKTIPREEYCSCVDTSSDEKIPWTEEQ
ncbi:hypothetical protein BDZ45DRAFT_687792 [Acephala macrosclerotiorum]|nr:hypothetical protein BDZ45DRAFT_687792 [Acephala macrosclerotiorum]